MLPGIAKSIFIAKWMLAQVHETAQSGTKRLAYPAGATQYPWPMSKPAEPGSPARFVAGTGTLEQPPPPGDAAADRWPKAAVCATLAAMVWAVFGQTRRFEFINYDDPAYVCDNPLTNQGLGWHNLLQVFASTCHHAWFPVTFISQMVDSQLYGAGAGGPHVTNVLLHAATAILLFLVLSQMTGTFWRSAFVAATFAIHPLRVESVAWVVERKDVLSGLFFMLTLWAWSRYVQPCPALGKVGPNPAVGTATHWLPSYLAALVFFALGLLAKSMLVTLPFVLLLLDYWPLKRLPRPGSSHGAWLRLIGEKIPFLLLSIGSGVATVVTQMNLMLAAQHVPLLWRAGNVLLTYAVYLQHTIYPAGLALVYPASNANLSWLSVGLALGVLLVISAGALAWHRRQPALLVGWLWYLGMLLPIIDGMQATQNVRSDRFTYLPQIGLCILAAWGGVELARGWRYQRVLLASAAVVILAALLLAAHRQTGYWRDSVAVWNRTLACTSGNYFAENMLGSALSNQEKWNEAVPHFERSLEVRPDYPEARLNLGIALADLAKPDAAIQQFRRVLQLNPQHDEANYHLGDVLINQGRTAEAISYFLQALQTNPDYPEAHFDLGFALARQERWADATAHYEQALHQKLDESDAQYITGVALAAHHHWDQAIPLYEQVLRARPDLASAHYRLAIALASQGRPVEARQHFQRALALATAQGDAALAASIRKQSTALLPAAPPP